jgi:AcrR family transcriptional regulator
VGRWQPDAAGRLQDAALTLYGERGFDNTTVAEIAERAGLTKRTFFRYFADKREVLFRGSEELQALFVGGVAGAPEDATPMGAVMVALDAVGELFEERREFAVRRSLIIAANPELQERELIKMASIAAAVAQALRRRGVTDPTAVLTAEAGIAVFRTSFARWVQPGNDASFPDLVRASLDELRAATAA